MSLVFEHVEFELVRDIQKDVFCKYLDLESKGLSSRIETIQD